MREFDLIVVGGGPAGYVGALRASQLGLSVACIDERPTLGGTCLNVGCIPSKALLSSSEHLSELKHLASHGITLGAPALDLATMMARKDKVVDDLTKGVDHLLKKSGIVRVVGKATLAPGNLVKVGNETLSAKDILLAVGSEPTPLPNATIDEEFILSSTGALSLPRVPDNLIVIGAGVIGLELGQVWARLGAKVTVIEFLDRILPGADAEVAKTAQRLLTRQGLAFQVGRKTTDISRKGNGVEVCVERRETGQTEVIEADAVLVAIGRRPRTSELGLDELGIETDERGFIIVDEQFRTTIPNVLAVGDCVHGPMLAHKAEDDALAAVEALAGHEHSPADYGSVPSVIYTSPEIAAVGQRYGVFTNDEGGILDDFMFANRGDHLFLVVNASCKKQDIMHLRKHISDVCAIEELADRGLIALQGPAAEAALARLAPEVADLAFMDVADITIEGTRCIVSRSGYSGEDGYEISVPGIDAVNVAKAFLRDPNVLPVGLGARDSLRLEAGLCLYGNDIDPTTTPVSAKLEWAIQNVRRAAGARAGGFPGAETILREFESGPPQKRVGLAPEGRAPVRAGALLFRDEASSAAIGRVTSGCFGPSVGRPVAMGYVDCCHAQRDILLFADVRGKRLPVAVCGLPFITPRYKRT